MASDLATTCETAHQNLESDLPSRLYRDHASCAERWGRGVMFRAPTLSVVLPRMALDAWWNAWLATWQDIGDEVLGYEEDPNFESEMPICHDPANAEWS